MSCDNCEKCKNIFIQNICTTIGFQVDAQVLNFDVDITQKDFIYECRDVFVGNEFSQKTIGNGMYINAPGQLVIEGFLENRSPGEKYAFLVCIDQDGPRKIFEWKIEVQQ